MLQQNPADTTAALLLIIAQHQVGVGLDPSRLVEPPTFSPATSSLWINGLWFVSLALALAAALVTMLSKEWLTAYMASRPRPAHTHALLRQARLDGINSWWALHIIAFLPTLLHLSLLLFALGLVVYLWTLEVTVAAVTGVVVALTLMFYLGTTLLGAIVPFCPFVTEISMYTKRAGGAKLGTWLHLHQEHNASQPSPGNRHETTLEDIRAITWLAESARDPVTIDCSYQCLSGMRPPTHPVAPDTSHSDIYTERWYKSLNHIFPTVLARFGALLQDGRELAASRGINAARYSRALVELALFLDPANMTTDAEPAINQPEKRARPKLDSFPFPSFSDSVALPAALPRAELALQTLDGVWRDEHPPFSANTFASLTAAEIRLAVLAASISRGNESPPRTPRTPALETQGGEEAVDSTAIDISPSRISISSLRATYTRSLVRASVQLRYHTDGRTPIESFALATLLDALRIGASCATLNPELPPTSIPAINDHSDGAESGLPLPTKEPRAQIRAEPDPSFIIPVFSFDHYLRPTDLSRGPLGCVVRLLGTSALRSRNSGVVPSKLPGARPRVRLAAARALAALAPVMLKRWVILKTSRSGTGVIEADDPDASTPDFADWPKVDADLDALRLEAAITTQLLLIIRVVGPHLERAGAANLAEVALAEMNRIATVIPYSAYLALRRHVAPYFAPLLEHISGNGNEGNPTLLGSAAKAHIVNLLTFEIPGKQPFRRTHISPHLIPHLLRTLQDLPGNVPLARSALKYVVDRVRDTSSSMDYLRRFTHSDQGYASLTAIGVVHEAYVEHVVNAILQITHVAVSGGPNTRTDPIALGTPAIAGFLDSISLVARHTAQMIDKQNHRHLHSFGRNMIAALRRIEPDAAQTVLEHGALEEVIAALQAHRNRSDTMGSGSGSGGGSGTGRSNAPTSEYLLAQLHALKGKFLPDLAASWAGETDHNERGQEEDLAVYAI